jgi:hypothetical protein
MKIRQLWDEQTGRVRIRLQEIRGDGKPPEYPITRTTWARAIRIRNKFGSERALELIDERAWRAFERHDDGTSRRWRNLIIAIHAMEEDELLPGETAQ